MHKLIEKAVVGTIIAMASLAGLSATGYAGSNNTVGAQPSTNPKTLAEAQLRWPSAVYLPSGIARASGLYIVSRGTDYVLMGVDAGPISVVRPTSAVKGFLPLHNVDASGRWGNYSCSTTVYGYVNVWEWANATKTELDTNDHVLACYQSWNDTLTAGCSGFGTCSPAQTGVIGQGAYQVNPWDNQLVTYPPGFSDTYYCRVYLNADTTWSAWCN